MASKSLSFNKTMMMKGCEKLAPSTAARDIIQHSSDAMFHPIASFSIQASQLFGNRTMSVRQPNHGLNTLMIAGQSSHMSSVLGMSGGQSVGGFSPRRCLQVCQASSSSNVGTDQIIQNKESQTRGRQRSVEKVLTATRVGDEGAVRIFGPGTDLPEGFGPFLTLDEFFLAPSQALAFPQNPGLIESLVYFLETPQPEPAESNHPADDLPNPAETLNPQNLAASEEVDQPRHGLQLFFRSAFQPMAEASDGPPASDGMPSDGETELHQPIVSHGREAEFVPEATVAGAATVRVAAGGYRSALAGPPLDRFQLLDVTMSRDCQLDIPVRSEAGALVYILEGVGLFGGEASVASASYQNEGHALWLPPTSSSDARQNSVSEEVLLIRTNKMSGLRFIFLSGASKVAAGR